MPKAVNHSGCAIPGPRALQSDMLPLDHYNSYKFAFKTLPCHHVAVVVFLLTERYGDVHKLVDVRICTPRRSLFHVGILVFFSLGVRHVCLSNVTTA